MVIKVNENLIYEKFKCVYRANKTQEQFKKPIPPPPPRDRLIKEGAIPPKPKQK